MKCLVVVGQILYDRLAEFGSCKASELIIRHKYARSIAKNMVEKTYKDWWLIACQEPKREEAESWIESYLSSVSRRFKSDHLEELCVAFHKRYMVGAAPHEFQTCRWTHQRYQAVEEKLGKIAGVPKNVRVRGYHTVSNLCTAIGRLPAAIGTALFDDYMRYIEWEMDHSDVNVSVETQHPLELFPKEELLRALIQLQHDIPALFSNLHGHLQGIRKSTGDARKTRIDDFIAEYNADPGIWGCWADFQFLLNGADSITVRFTRNRQTKLRTQLNEKALPQVGGRYVSLRQAVQTICYRKEDLERFKIICGLQGESWKGAGPRGFIDFLKSLDLAIRKRDHLGLITMAGNNENSSFNGKELYRWIQRLAAELYRIARMAGTTTL